MAGGNGAVVETIGDNNRSAHPLRTAGGGFRCPRCGHQAPYFDALAIVPEWSAYLVPVRKCPACKHLFALHPCPDER